MDLVSDNMSWSDTITNDLIAAEILKQDTTVEDFVAILPNTTIEFFDNLEKSAHRSAVPQEEPMAPEGDIEMDGLTEEQAAYVAELEETTLSLAKRLDEKDEELAELNKKLEGLEGSDSSDDEPDDIMKSLPPEVLEIIKADRTRLEKAEKALAAERHERMRRDYIAKAAGYDGVVDDLEDFAEIMLAIDESLPEVGVRLTKVLETARERIAKGLLFEELGSNAEGGGDAYEKATTLAKGLVAAGEFDSIEEARAEVWSENPDLFDEYQIERRAARH